MFASVWLECGDVHAISMERAMAEMRLRLERAGVG